MSESKALATTAPAEPLPWDMRITAERLALVAESVDWELPQTDGQPLQGEALRGWCADRNEGASQRFSELGLGLWMLKREMGQGAFGGWCQEAGIPSRTANDAMQLARLIFGAPETAVPTLTQLPRGKLRALAPGGQQLIAALVQDGTMAEVPAMDRDSIRALVRERMETEALRTSLDEIAAQRDAALESNKRLAALPAPSRRLSALRLAALEEIERLRSNALAMQRIVYELHAFPQGLDDMGYDEACHALVYGLQGLEAIVERGIFEGMALREHYAPHDRLPAPLVSADEEARVRDWAAQFLADADLRHAARVAAASVDDHLPAGRAAAKRRGRK